MAVGTIQKSALTNIANAILVQNGGAGTMFSSSRYSGTYMRIDGGVASPGCLTAKE